VKLWLTRRSVKARVDAINARFRPLVEAAERSRNANTVSELQDAWAMERDQALSELWDVELSTLRSTAAKYNVAIPPQSDDSAYWEFSNRTGDWYLSQEGRNLVEERIETRKELKFKWVTRTLSVWGLFIALLSAAFSAWQAYEASETRRDSVVVVRQAREDAREAMQEQRRDEEIRAAENKKINEKQLEMARAAVEQANRSAKAAELTASTSTRSLQISERAYLSIEVPQDIELKAENDYRISIEYHNNGKTPAASVFTYAAVVSGPNQSLAQWLYANLPNPAPSLSEVGGGGILANVLIGSPMGEERLAALKKGPERLFLFAEASYVDIFGDKRRVTGCWYYAFRTTHWEHCPEALSVYRLP
jgi:hypothetical protein